MSNDLRFSRLGISGTTYLLKLQLLKITGHRTIGSFPRCTPVRDLRTALILSYVHNYLTKLCRQQAVVITKL
jgi:hypothetical protein